LRFGAYQERRGGDLIVYGLFYDPEGLTPGEQSTLRAYAADHGMKILTVPEFVEDVFYGFAYDLRAQIVGFNLPFDISRLAVAHGLARRQMRGGFSFRLSKEPYRPRVQIKHLSSRAALIQFAAPRKQRTARSERKHRQYVPPRRGYLVDVKTQAAALLSQSHSLASLARFLKTPHQKLDANGHGRRLTKQYLDYAVNDVQVTWECFISLSELHERHGLSQTPMHAIYSEASVGKAYLKQMNIRPWRSSPRSAG